MQAFELTESDPRPGCRQIEIHGELDLAVADRLQEAIDRGAGHRQILIDLADCDFIDSTGIAVILRAHNQLEEKGRRLSVCEANSQVLRVLTVTGLTANGLVFESAAQVLRALPES
jgi:anti-anti-sigma factor